MRRRKFEEAIPLIQFLWQLQEGLEGSFPAAARAKLQELPASCVALLDDARARFPKALLNRLDEVHLLLLPA